MYKETKKNQKKENSKDDLQEVFQGKIKAFSESLEKLQEEYGLILYATNVVLDSGEVVPSFRVRKKE